MALLPWMGIPCRGRGREILSKTDLRRVVVSESKQTIFCSQLPYQATSRKVVLHGFKREAWIEKFGKVDTWASNRANYLHFTVCLADW